jgi:hypothetical protein
VVSGNSWIMFYRRLKGLSGEWQFIERLHRERYVVDSDATPCTIKDQQERSL